MKYIDIDDVMEKAWRLSLDNDSKFKIVALIVVRNKIISLGYNQMKSHTFQKEFGKNNFSIYFHAETHAIYNALKVIDRQKLKQSSLYIARSKFSDQYRNTYIKGLAKPCDGCMKCITYYKIPNIYYTLDNCSIMAHINQLHKVRV